MKKGAIIGAMLLFLYAGFRPPEGVSKIPIADISFASQTVSHVSSAANENESEESELGK